MVGGLGSNSEIKFYYEFGKLVSIVEMTKQKIFEVVDNVYIYIYIRHNR